MNKDDFMSLLKNKKAVIKMVVKDLDICRKNELAFSKMVDSLEEGKELDYKKVLLAFAKSSKHLNEVSSRLSILAMVYCSGGDFSSDVAKLLANMGHGQEALQELFNQKLNDG